MRKLMNYEVEEVLGAPRNDTVKPSERDAFVKPDRVEMPDDLGHLQGR
jgi:hypothetical protein